MQRYKIVKTPYFAEWFSKLTAREQWQILGRLDRITNAGHFGITNWLDRETNLW